MKHRLAPWIFLSGFLLATFGGVLDIYTVVWWGCLVMILSIAVAITETWILILFPGDDREL